MTDTTATTVELTERDTVGDAVVRAVAEATGTDPMQLDPLYEVVDPDALDRLFRSREIRGAGADARVAFSMAGCAVTVYASGEVVATPVGDSQREPAEAIEAPNPVHE